MSSIGGNTEAFIQISVVRQNDIGNEIPDWQDAFYKPLEGFLDMTGEGTNTSRLMHKVEDVDYIFICDYFDTKTVDGIKLSAENSRMLIGGEVYEVKAYDDPMGLHEHMEIYLKYMGGQS